MCRVTLKTQDLPILINNKLASARELVRSKKKSERRMSRGRRRDEEKRASNEERRRRRSDVEARAPAENGEMNVDSVGKRLPTRQMQWLHADEL